MSVALRTQILGYPLRSRRGGGRPSPTNTPAWALDLDGASQKLTSSSSDLAWGAGDDVWVSGLVKFDTVSGEQMVVGSFDAGQANLLSWGVFLQNGKLLFRISEDGLNSSPYKECIDPADVTAGVWYHFVAWTDTAAGAMKFRVNDRPYTLVNSTAGPSATVEPFTVGFHDYSGDSYLNGQVDSLAFGKPSAAIATVIDDVCETLYYHGLGLHYNLLTTQEKSDWGVVSFWDLEEASGLRYDSHGTNDLTPANSPGRAAGKAVGTTSLLASTVTASWQAKTLRGGALRDRKGNGHTAQLGSTKGACIDYDYDGAVCLKLPGLSGHYAWSSDSAAVSLTGDLDLRVKVALDDWTPAADTTLLSKSTAGAFSYLLRMRGSGKPTFIVGGAGGALSTNVDATAAVSFTDGNAGWVRVTFTVATGVVRFYTSTDGTTWTQLGTDVAGTAAAVYDGTQPVEIGSYNGGANDLAAGKFYRAIIKNGIDGTTVFDANFESAVPGTVALVESSANAAVVTIGQRAVVTDGFLWLPGVSGNYASLADSSALSVTGDIDLRVKVALADWTTGSFQALFGKWAAGSPRAYVLYVNTTGGLRFNVNATGPVAISVDSSVALGFADGTAKWVRVTRASASGDIKFYTSDDGVTWTQLGTTQAGAAGALVDTTDPVQIGAANSADFCAGKFYRAVIYSDLTETTKVLDVNFSQDHNTAGFAENSSSGAWVSINATALPGSDSNEPLFLPFRGEKYLYLPGATGNYASSPSAAAVTVTGDIDIRIKVALADYTPSGTTSLFRKLGTGGQHCYDLRLSTLGNLDWRGSTDGSTFASAATSTAGLNLLPDGAPIWIRVTRASATGTVTFYTSVDGSNWTQLGAAVASGSGALFAGTDAIQLGGASGGGEEMTGKYYRAILKNGINGTTVFDANFNSATEPYATFTESSANARTVTINRGSTGRKAALVDRDLFLLGTDDRLEIADHAELDFANTDSFSVVLVRRIYGTPSGNQPMLAKQTNLTSTAGYTIYANNAGNVVNHVGDGTAEQFLTGKAINAGYVVMNALVGDTANWKSYADASESTDADTLTGSLANALPLYIGTNASQYADMEFVAAAIVRTNLTAAQLAQLKTELLA